MSLRAVPQALTGNPAVPLTSSGEGLTVTLFFSDQSGRPGNIHMSNAFVSAAFLLSNGG